VRRVLHNVADITFTPCAIERGVVVKLHPSLKYHDLPPGAVTAISERECERLERDALVTRLVPAVAA
jgi:hypothetical protein